MINYITKQSNGSVSVSISAQAMNRLEAHRPTGCPFDGYTMLDLLKDWIQMYAWQITQKSISLVDFIKSIRGDEKLAVYGDAMVALLAQ